MRRAIVPKPAARGDSYAEAFWHRPSVVCSADRVASSTHWLHAPSRAGSSGWCSRSTVSGRNRRTSRAPGQETGCFSGGGTHTVGCRTANCTAPYLEAARTEQKLGTAVIATATAPEERIPVICVDPLGYL